MRLLLALVALVVAGLACLALFHEPPRDGGGPAATDDAPDSEAGTRPPIAGTPPGELPELPKDPLRAGLVGLLEELARGGAMARDRQALALEVERLLEEERLGDSRRRARVAKEAAAALQEKAQDREAAAVVPAALQERARALAARELAVDLRLRLRLDRDGGRHSGRRLGALPELPETPGHRRVPWNMLAGFAFRPDEPLPGTVRRLDGRRVVLAGYILPLEGITRTARFLLVESTWACCFGQPPRVNQVVVCRLEDRPPVATRSTPVLVQGVLEVGPRTEDGHVISLYRMRVDTVRSAFEPR